MSMVARPSLDRYSWWPVSPAVPIIAFAKDWNEEPTSNHHVLRGLARSHRVLWLNSVATRTPKLASGRDMRKIVQKLAAFSSGPVNVENDLWVYTPLVLPLPHSAAARRINRQVLRATLSVIKRRLGLSEFVLWTFLPNVADYLGVLGASMTVYYCVDEWSMFSYMDRTATQAAERRLLESVDCVFAVTHALAERKRAVNPETHLSPHGVDHALFSQALDAKTRVPEDVATLPRPVVGFYGTIQDWVDLELIAYLARSQPAWSFVLLGQVMVSTAAVAGLPNVHLPGKRKHGELPAYCKGFDVGLIPYRIDERMPFVNPIKLREYLAAGLPVVSTAVPEVMRYQHWCSVGNTHEEVRGAIQRALQEDSPERRRERSRAMEGETWQARLAEIERVVEDVAARKRGNRRS
jgi:glycosyltransferase involved in cell wall biosynthesis